MHEDDPMTTFIALLRGVNVGGHNKVPMADLRAALDASGFARVRTYIQSGNVLVDATRTTADKVSARVHDVISSEFDVDVPVITLDAGTLATVVHQNPYPDEPDHKRLHAILLPGPPDPTSQARLKELADAFADKGSRDTFTLIGSTLYLHTPDGFGSSDLARALTAKGKHAGLNGTARNWATMTTLLEMAAT
jgi:uncharacterized protein (DUF1697 family)